MRTYNVRYDSFSDRLRTIPLTSDSRLLALLGMFASGRAYSAAELATHFDVTPRSVRRDITSLRELGYVIDSLPGAAGGYRAQSRTVLPPLQLETGEALATAVGLALLNGAGLGTSFADSATAKLRGMLPAEIRQTVGDIGTAVSVLPGHEPGVDMATVMTTASAIASLNVLTFAYKKRKQSGTEAMARRVEPVHMVVLGAHWYLYAWDLDRVDWRVFRLDRMSQVHETTFAFAPRDHPDAEAAVSSAVTTDAYRHMVILQVEATVPEVKAWFPSRSATITRTDDGTRVEFGVEDLAWAAVITAATPVPFRVVEPPELLIALKDLGERASQVSTSGSSRADSTEVSTGLNRHR